MDLYGFIRRGVFAMPQLWGSLLIALGGLAALGAFFIQKENTASGRSTPVRAMLFAPLSLVLGLGFAIGITALIAMIRPETNFGSAHPWALRATQNAAALLGAVLMFALCYRPGANLRLLHASWFWFALAGLAAAYFLPGAAILFAPSLIIFIIAAVLNFLGMGMLPVSRCFWQWCFSPALFYR